jgi:hypothetical protein
MHLVRITATLSAALTTLVVPEYRDEHHAVDVASPNRSTAGALDITREGPNAMAVETILTPSGRGSPRPPARPAGLPAQATTATTHSLLDTDRSGYLTACGKPSGPVPTATRRSPPSPDQSVTC